MGVIVGLVKTDAGSVGRSAVSLLAERLKGEGPLRGERPLGGPLDLPLSPGVMPPLSCGGGVSGCCDGGGEEHGVGSEGVGATTGRLAGLGAAAGLVGIGEGDGFLFALCDGVLAVEDSSPFAVGASIRSPAYLPAGSSAAATRSSATGAMPSSEVSAKESVTSSRAATFVFDRDGERWCREAE